MVCGWGQPIHEFYSNFSSTPSFTLGVYTRNISMICWKPRILWRVQTCTDTWNGLGTRTEWVTTVHHLNPFVILLRDSTYFDPLMKKEVEEHVTLERILHKVTNWGGQRRPNSTWKPFSNSQEGCGLEDPWERPSVHVGSKWKEIQIF